MSKFFLIILISTISSITVFSGESWIKTNGPWGGTVYVVMASNPGTLFAGTNSGVYQSSDKGISWSYFGLSGSKIADVKIAVNGYIWACGDDGIYLSTNIGSTWKLKSQDKFTNCANIRFSSNGYVYVTGKNTNQPTSIYYTSNNGTLWTKSEIFNASINSFFLVDNNTIIAGTYLSGIYISTDNGANWVSKGLDTISVSCFGRDSNGKLYAGTVNNGIFKSEDNGNSWVQSSLSDVSINSILVDSINVIWAGSHGKGIYKSSDSGNSFVSLNNGLKILDIFCVFQICNGEFLAGTYSDGIYKTIDNGNVWMESNHGLDNFVISDLVINSSNEIFASSVGSGILYTSDNGLNWAKLSSNPDLNITKLGINSKGYIIAGTLSRGIFLSMDGGKNWLNIKEVVSRSDRVMSIAVDDSDKIYVSIEGEGIYCTRDNGLKWIDLGLKNGGKINSIAAGRGGVIFAGTETKGMFRSRNFGESWDSLGLGTYAVLSLMITARGALVAGCAHGKIYRSYDNGNSWEEKGSLFYDVNELLESGEGIYYGALNTNGPYISPDFGDTWGPYTNIIGKVTVNCLSVNRGDILFAGTAKGVYRSVPAYKVLSAPLLAYPGSGLTNVAISLKFVWYKQRNADKYEIMVSENGDYSVNLCDELIEGDNYYVFSGLENNHYYHWRVRALRGDTVSGWSEDWIFRAMMPAPEQEVPENNAKNLDTAIFFGWRGVGYAENYEIEISGDESFGKGGLLYSGYSFAPGSHSFSADLDSKYYWRVKAVNSEGESEWSGTRDFGTMMKAPELVMPGDEEEDLDTNVVLRWRDYGDVTNYYLEVAEDSCFKKMLVEDMKLKDTMRKVEGLEFGRRYWWKVMVKFGLKLSYWSDVRGFRTGMEAPVIIEPVKGFRSYGSSVVFFWRKYEGADLYHLRVCPDSGFKKGGYNDSAIGGVSMNVVDLKAGRRYYYKLRAKVGGRWSFWSDIGYFDIGERDTVPEMPVLVYPGDNGDGLDTAVVFRWDRGYGAKGYGFELSRDDFFEGGMVVDSVCLDTVLWVGGLVYGGLYFWRVRSLRDSLESGWSVVRGFRTRVKTGVLDGMVMDDGLEVFPNPGWGCVYVVFDNGLGGYVSLWVMDNEGRFVCGLFDGFLGKGRCEFVWDVDDEACRNLSCGVYWVILSCEGVVRRRKLVLGG